MPCSLAGRIVGCKMRLLCLMSPPSPRCWESSPAVPGAGLPPWRKVCGIDCHMGSYIFHTTAGINVHMQIMLENCARRDCHPKQKEK